MGRHKKRFFINESSNPDYVGQTFLAFTQIKEEVELEFTDDVYRCIMFTGIRIKLVKDDDYIIGDLY